METSKQQNSYRELSKEEKINVCRGMIPILLGLMLIFFFFGWWFLLSYIYGSVIGLMIVVPAAHAQKYQACYTGQ